VGVSVMAFSYHRLLDGSERVARAQGMRALADSIRARVGARFPLTHVDTPFVLQFFLGSAAPLASVEQAARLLSGPDATFIAVRHLDSLRSALAQTPTPFFVVARWPTTGEPDVSVISNHALLEWTADMSAVFSPIVIRTHGVRFVRRREREFVLNLTGDNGAVVFENESREPQAVRARMTGGTSETVQERLLAPGDQWRVTVSREGGRPSPGAGQGPIDARAPPGES
jgi:hypothetical protein